jgi:hypothetical protein
MEKELKNLQLNHTYLIKKDSDIVSSITVLIITNKAFHVRWNRGQESKDTWELKDYVYRNYTLVEDISNFVLENLQTTTGKASVLDVKTKLVQCYVCKGFGTIPDNSSTAGTKTCPLCQGAKMIPESTEIIQR